MPFFPHILINQSIKRIFSIVNYKIWEYPNSSSSDNKFLFGIGVAYDIRLYNMVTFDKYIQTKVEYYF